MFGLTDAVGRATTRAASYAAICVLTVCAGTVGASAETRTLKIYHLHTHEKEEIAYKRDGRYLSDGLKKINWILRDWRQKKPVNMDPRLLDLVWEAYRQSGSRAYISVICGYRSSETNGMLRSRTSGVARESQHMLGKALDFTLPDVPLAKLRAIGLKMQIGGVGFYPKSGSPFVHFDVGNVRHWPKMSRRELMAVFPNGNTLHVPSDGKPLPGYEQALASYKSRKSSDSIQVANAGDGSSGRTGGGKTLLAMLFGGGADEEEDTAESEVAPAKVAPRAVASEAPKVMKPQAPAKLEPEPTLAVAAAATKRETLPSGVPLPIRDTFDTSGPKTMVPPAAVATPADAEPTEVAALDMSRIPLPSAAPVRETALIAEAAKVPVPTGPVAAPKPADEALLAALQTAPSPEDIAANEAGQLAYAVPTPRARPPFASVLKQEMPAAANIDEVKAITETATAQTSIEKVIQTASAPSPAVPLQAPAVPAAAMPSHPAQAAPAPVVLASLESPRKAKAVATIKQAAIPEGKTGRMVRQAVKAVSAPGSAGPAASQKTISDRIRVADLVTADLGKRSEVTRMIHPNANGLIRSVPTAVLASGFSGETPSADRDRFAGTAVNFMPMIKVD